MSLWKWVLLLCVVVGLGIWALLCWTQPHEPVFESMDRGIHVKERVREMIPTLNHMAAPAQVLDTFELLGRKDQSGDSGE